MLPLEEIYRIYLEHPIISTDTRSIENNSLFFALKGDNFNANAFALEALEKGAAYAIVDDVALPVHERLIVVPDVLKTLQDLAQYHRRQFSIPFIGITGSNGKTTTKELLNVVLSKKFKVLATKGNFNNHIGVPLTLLKLRSDHEIAIIEMGANNMNDIDFLCRIAEPDYGIITNIGKAHLKGFGSYEGVRQAKTALYRFIAERRGMVFVNAEDPILMEDSTVNNRITFGDSATCRGSYKTIEDGSILLTLSDGEMSRQVQTKLFGSYNFQNLLCACSVGKYFGISLDEIAEGLASYEPHNNRSQIVLTSQNTLILDAYNANPSSMALAIQSFMELEGKNKVLILGDMLELGDEQDAEHLKIIDMISGLNLYEIFLVGEIFRKNAPTSIRTFGTVDELNSYLDLNSLEGCKILIKGSRGIQLEKVVENIS
jgi:UDP-N-acetylmuramoyl-tripeptide--D-alanyl-D-alanine ligase